MILNLMGIDFWLYFLDLLCVVYRFEIEGFDLDRKIDNYLIKRFLIIGKKCKIKILLIYDYK